MPVRLRMLAENHRLTWDQMDEATDGSGLGLDLSPPCWNAHLFRLPRHEARAMTSIGWGRASAARTLSGVGAASPTPQEDQPVVRMDRDGDLLMRVTRPIAPRGVRAASARWREMTGNSRRIWCLTQRAKLRSVHLISSLGWSRRPVTS